MLKPDGHATVSRTMVFELCEWLCSLGVQALGAVAAEFHEDAGAAGFAADTVSLSVKRFEASTDGALVVNEFNHSSLSDVRDRASCFEPFIGFFGAPMPRKWVQTSRPSDLFDKGG